VLEPDEVTLLPELLGRPPRWAEAVLFGILWSEHCSYKSTRHL
jgi:phosphoribosylformylglycinamidine synthase